MGASEAGGENVQHGLREGILWNEEPGRQPCGVLQPELRTVIWMESRGTVRNGTIFYPPLSFTLLPGAWQAASKWWWLNEASALTCDIYTASVPAQKAQT